MRGLFITGTDTGIGKTLVTGALTYALRQEKYDVWPVKAIGSGGVPLQGEIISEDALYYLHFIAAPDDLRSLNPLCFEYPASPHLAAQLENRQIDKGMIFKALQNLSTRYESLLVEGVGGWLVPLSLEYSVADFAEELGMDVLLVSANRLGTINHTLLTLESIRARGLNVAGVIFSTPQPESDLQIAQNNVESIKRLGNVEVLGEIPYLGAESEHPAILQRIKNETKEWLAWERIQEIIRIAGNR